MLSAVQISDCVTPEFIQPHLLFAACIPPGGIEAANSFGNGNFVS
jgi:hypothetical protein